MNLCRSAANIIQWTIRHIFFKMRNKIWCLPSTLLLMIILGFLAKAVRKKKKWQKRNKDKKKRNKTIVLEIDVIAEDRAQQTMAYRPKLACHLSL